MTQKDILQDRLRGSMIGGAVGDALGYPVEFISSFSDIVARYGEQGITRYDKNKRWMFQPGGNGKAVFSDDTQMTLFTACGLLNAEAQGCAPVSSVLRAYVEWYYTQMGERRPGFKDCWVGDLPEMNAQRAPGNTCMDALATVIEGRTPHNDSKGCGGIMRIAPVALYGTVHSQDVKDVDRLAAEVSALTHLHPLGYIPSALIAHVIYRLVQDENPTRETFGQYVREGLQTVAELYPEHPEAVSYLTRLIEKALRLAGEEGDDVEIIETHLGGGWVAEETAAIAIYCTLKYFDDFEKAMIASVNHAGDSDSTGAVTGNVLGAALGYEAIPDFYQTDLELHDVLLHVADDLWRGETTPYVK